MMSRINSRNQPGNLRLGVHPTRRFQGERARDQVAQPAPLGQGEDRPPPPPPAARHEIRVVEEDTSEKL